MTLFQQQTLHAKLRRRLTTARWCGGYNAAARVVAFHASGTTNEGNILAPSNTRPDQTLTLKTERKACASRTVVSLPWRRPWRPRFRRKGKKVIRPHQGATEATNTSRRWRWMRRNDWRDGDGGGAVQRTRRDDRGEEVLGGCGGASAGEGEGRMGKNEGAAECGRALGS